MQIKWLAFASLYHFSMMLQCTCACSCASICALPVSAARHISLTIKKSPDLSGALACRRHSNLCYIDLPAKDYYFRRSPPRKSVHRNTDCFLLLVCRKPEVIAYSIRHRFTALWAVHLCHPSLGLLTALSFLEIFFRDTSKFNLHMCIFICMHMCIIFNPLPSAFSVSFHPRVHQSIFPGLLRRPARQVQQHETVSCMTGASDHQDIP